MWGKQAFKMRFFHIQYRTRKKLGLSAYLGNIAYPIRTLLASSMYLFRTGGGLDVGVPRRRSLCKQVFR